jgi:hypothetical protein
MNLTDRYLDCWNETEATARRKLIEDVFAPDAAYIDPMAEAHGLDAIDATIAAVQAQFPDLVFSPIGLVDAHHNLVRFTWVLVSTETGEAQRVGSELFVLADDGRIKHDYQFLLKPAIADWADY